MGMFVSIQIESSKCPDPASCARCLKACPVDAFSLQEGRLATAYDNEDECTLCYLCQEQCPHAAVKVVKLY